MIYLFVGENYFRKKILNIWKTSFSQKFTQHNIIHIRNVFDYDFSFYEQNLLSNGIFSEKIFFILDDFPFACDDENSENFQKFQDFFLSLLPKISQENIVVFNNLRVDKRSKIYKEIVKNGEIKDFTIQNEGEMIAKIKEIWGDKISLSAINKMIELKGLNFSTIQNELEKLFITLDFVDQKDLVLISKDIEESIFEIINDILSEKKLNAIKKMQDLSVLLDNPYLLYNSLISNLRIYFYIFLLKDAKKTNTQIKDILELANRSFLVDKNYKISFSKFKRIYQNLIGIDAKMKTGKLLGNENAEMMYEIEKSLIL